MPNATGQGFVDYVLWGDDGKRQAELYVPTAWSSATGSDR